MESARLNWTRDAGLLTIRLMVGSVFLFHGSQKLFGVADGPGLAGFAQFLDTLGIPYPAYGAALAGIAEFAGGLSLITGWGQRWMMVPLATTMGVAVYFVHRDAFQVRHNGMEYALTLGVVAIGMALTGPGRLRLPDLTSAWTLPKWKRFATNGSAVKPPTEPRPTEPRPTEPRPTESRPTSAPRERERPAKFRTDAAPRPLAPPEFNAT